MKQGLVILLSILLFSCSKEGSKIAVNASYFELGDCFSTNSLVGQQQIIRDKQSYKNFEDEIRRHIFPSCDTVFLPEIDFDNYFFVGYYTATSGCDVNYNRSIYYLFNNKYDYEISVSHIGDCEMMLSSFNCAVVPLQSDSTIVNFKVSYK